MTGMGTEKVKMEKVTMAGGDHGRGDGGGSDDVVYLNWGASGPETPAVTRAVREAGEAHAASHLDGDPYDHAETVYDEARSAVARLGGCRVEEVALTSNTTEGIAVVADALDLGPGDAVVTTELEHPAGRLPWHRLADLRGLEVRTVPDRRGRLDETGFESACRGARLACFSSVSWCYGTRLPVERLVDVAHDAGALALVDAAQTPGHLELDVGDWGADFVAATGHKWLRGPWGAGFLVVSRDALPGLEPSRVGYRGVVDPEADAAYEYHDDARALELSTRSPALYAGLARAARDAADRAAGIESEVLELAGRLHSALGGRAALDSAESGLVSFEADDPDATVHMLRERDVVVRAVPAGLVRASVHAYDSPEDVEALVDNLG